MWFNLACFYYGGIEWGSPYIVFSIGGEIRLSCLSK